MFLLQLFACAPSPGTTVYWLEGTEQHHGVVMKPTDVIMNPVTIEVEKCPTESVEGEAIVRVNEFGQLRCLIAGHYSTTPPKQNESKQ